MRKILLFAAIAAIVCSCGKRTGYTIAGHIEGLDVPMVYLIDQESTGLVSDSSEVKSGKFRFEGVVAEPVMVEIIDGYEIFATLILENGRITVKGNMEDLDSIKATGTPANDAFNEFMIPQYALLERFSAAETDEEREAILEENDIAIAQAVDDNLDNYFGLIMLKDMAHGMETDEISGNLDKFTPEMQNTKLGMEIRKQAEVKKRIAIGRPYTDIVLPDKDDNEVALSSYVGAGKYVLIDFWASWCNPCMMEMPYLKDTYDTYHKKGFEIFGVSLDGGASGESQWLDAVDKHNMNWIQVARLKAPESTATDDYAVTMIPANFLISPEGIIIAKNLRGEDLKKEIAKYLE